MRFMFNGFTWLFRPAHIIAIILKKTTSSQIQCCQPWHANVSIRLLGSCWKITFALVVSSALVRLYCTDNNCRWTTMASVTTLSSTRLGSLFYAKAASSTKALANASCSVRCKRNVCMSFRRQQSSMSAWVIDQYGTNEVLRVSDEIMMPNINLASELLIKVEAASLNPLDISMRGKWYWNACFSFSAEALLTRIHIHIDV